MPYYRRGTPTLSGIKLKLYEAKSLIERAGETSGEEFLYGFQIAEDSQDLVRAVIRASVSILGIPPSERIAPLPDTMEMVIDNYLFDTLRRPQGL